jgi:hypothetical protein
MLSIGVCRIGAEKDLNRRTEGTFSDATDIHNGAIVLSLFFLSLVLRVLFLGNTFQSSDNAELAFKILKNSGYTWIIREYYGALINVYVKFFVASVSFLGLTITEFWWKVPIAVIGSIQASLTYLFLKRRVHCSKAGALAGAAIVSILPLHVFESRYLWGYEVLAVFFVTLAIWSLINFFEKPTAGSGLVVSIFSGLYLVSHGYILPFVPILAAILFLFSPAKEAGIVAQFTSGCKLLVEKFVWVFPVLSIPLCVYPIGHALRKPTRLGFYLPDHLLGFVENIGYFLAVLLIGAAFVALFSRRAKSKYGLLFLIGAISYLAPLFFGTPPGITSIRGYMLVGTYFLVISAAVVFDKLVLVVGFRKPLVIIVISCCVLTFWGTVESIFGRDQLLDPSGVKVKRGGIPRDPGSKAAGFLIRKYVKDSEKVLAIHGAVEPPNMFYYFGRSQYSFFDLSYKRASEEFYKLKDNIDVVACSPDQTSILSSDESFHRRAVITSEGTPTMLIYAKTQVRMPNINADVRELNELFDKEYAWKVSLR